MGGKHRGANRTKNNTKPSSSGRSAAALNSSLPQFGVFSNLKPSAGLGQFAFSSIDELESSISENFQLVLKKISKKDSTTKLKGLQEFCDLVKKSDIEVVKTVLPAWPRFYNILATDANNRVREATHNVHHEIVKKVKRNIAPYLKQIIAPWFTSQYDNYPPAATAAIQAFKDTFSKSKFQDAIIFCQAEILNYIYDNLLIQTPQSIAGQNASPEEADAKYERVLLSCLQGYTLYLQQVPPEQINEAAEQNLQIVSNADFWKLGKSKIPLVRSAWFQVISAICQKAIFLLDKREAQVLSIILSSLDDGEPTVLPHVWECVLLVVSFIQEWWKFVNVDKHFIPKLANVLKLGGQGNAVIIYPSLLPLISHLEPIESNSLQFYTVIFDNMRLGLKHKLVINSRSETAAIATAFVECLQYIVNKNLSDLNFCKSLLKYQLLAVLEWCLLDNKSCYKPVFNQASFFIQYLGEHCESENVQTLLVFFFEHLQELFKILLNKAIKDNQEGIVDLSRKQIELLHMLKQVRKPKKYSKLQFNLNEGLKTKSGKDEEKSSATNIKYFQYLNQLVVKICHDYVQFIETSQSKILLEELCSLVMDFDRDQFFSSLMDNMKLSNPNASFIDIYDNLLKKWLELDNLYSKTVINLVFMLLFYLKDDDKHRVLLDLLKVEKPNALFWALSEALSYPYVEIAEVRKWLKEDKIGKFFLSIVDLHIRNECPPEVSVILKLALTENKDGDLFVTKDVLSEVINKLRSALLAGAESIIDPCCSLASYLCSIIYTESLLLSYGDSLLLTLVTLSCQIRSESEFISAETLQEMNSAWQDSVTLLLNQLPEETKPDLVRKFGTIIEEQFLLQDIKNKENVDHLTSVIVEFFRAIYRSIPHALSPFAQILFERPLISAFSQEASVLCKMAEYVLGCLSSPFEEVAINIPLSECNILRHFAWAFVKFNVFCTPIANDGERIVDDSEDYSDSENANEIFLILMDNPADIFLEALYNFSLGDSFLIHFNNVKYYNEILAYNALLEVKLSESGAALDMYTMNCVKTELRMRCLNSGWFWVKAFKHFYVECLSSNEAILLCHQWVDEAEQQNTIGVQHLKQIFQHDSDETPNDGQEAKMFERLQNLREENISEFHYSNPGSLSWEKCQQIIKSVRLCIALLKQENLPQNQWDLVVLSLVSWSSNCYKARHLLKNFQYHSMLLSVAELYVDLCIKIQQMKSNESNSSYVHEWEDVLLESVHGDLALIWLYLAEHLSTEGRVALYNLPLIEHFAKVTEHLDSHFIFKTNESLPKWTKFFKTSGTLLTNSNAVLQLWGYRMLLNCVKGLVDIDADAVSMNRPHSKGFIFEQFKGKLAHVEEVVNSMLIDFRVGEETCRIEPLSDSFTYAFAYLLLWDVMLTLYSSSSPELRYQYSEWLKNDNLFQHLLPNLLRLMPLEVLHYSEGKFKSLCNYFTSKPLDQNCYYKTCNSETIEQMACYLYKASLSYLPVLVRQWWANLDSRVSQIVDKITTLYVSPILCTEELNNVCQHQAKFKNMTVKVVHSKREIMAIYTIDEAQMELTIALPANYPLGSPDIQCNRQISGTIHKQWLLQFKKCVLHQNGRIWDGLSLWNNNLDKKFDGVEECYICYAVLHPGSYQLPKLCCGTCKKKFHSVCLYKWFSTSNKSSCPICRNLF